MILKHEGLIKREYVLHILLWVSVLLFPYIKFIEQEGGYSETFLHELNSILFIAIPSYGFYCWWLPMVQHRKWRMLPLLVLLLVGSIFIYEFTDGLFHGENFQPFSWKSFLSDVVKNSAFILFFLVLYLVKDSLKKKDQLDQVVKEKKHTEPASNQTHSEPTSEKIHYIYADKTTYKVKSAEILFIKAEVDYVKIVTSDRELLVLDSLKRWKEVLAHQGFIQAHRSYLVRVNAIVSLSSGQIELAKHTLPIGPTYKSDLKEAFQNNS